MGFSVTSGAGASLDFTELSYRDFVTYGDASALVADTKKIKLWTSLSKFTENSTKLNDF